VYSGGGVTYYYDGTSERVAKKTGTNAGKLYWFQDDNSPVAESDPAGTLTFEFIFGGWPTQSLNPELGGAPHKLVCVGFESKISLLMPRDLKRYYGANDLHFITLVATGAGSSSPSPRVATCSSAHSKKLHAITRSPSDTW
jgi:hypothetical protein